LNSGAAYFRDAMFRVATILAETATINGDIASEKDAQSYQFLADISDFVLI
jgi:hypothetical protein